MNKRIAAGILTAAITGGGAAGIVISRAATAETGGPSTTTAPADSTAPAGATPPAGDPTQRRTDELTKALQGLVDSGKITAEQRDAVIQAILAAQPAVGPRGRGGPFGPGRGPGMIGGPLGAGLDAAAKALGTDAATLRQALAGGKSIADVATDKGVAVDTVVQAVVAAETAQIDQAVTDGKMTKEQADKIKADLTQRITDMVNGKLPVGKGMGPMGGMPGHGPRGAGRRGQDPNATTPTTTPAGSSFSQSGQGTTTA